MTKSEDPQEISEEKRTELRQIALEIDQLEREMSARISLIRRRLKVAMGGKRTVGSNIFVMRSGAKERIIHMRGLGPE